jgi:hypothetical protein
MRHTILAGLSLAIVAASGPAAPVPKGKAPPDYYPLKVGATRVYQVGESTITTRVAAVDKKDGVSTATIETLVTDKIVSTEKLQVSDRGVFRIELNKLAIVPPICILRLPVRSGDAWQVDSRISDQPVTVQFVQRGNEAISVPLDDYKTVRVDGSGSIAGTQTDVSYWFAPDVGIVRIRYRVSGTESSLELKEYRK